MFSLITSLLIFRQERKEMEKKILQKKQETRKEHIQQRATEKKERSIAKVSLSLNTLCVQILEF